jgi:hypothetical protein
MSAVESRAIVPFDPDDPRFRAFVARIEDASGVYAFHLGKLVLKVGCAGDKPGPKAGLGHRIRKHVTDPDHPSHLRQFPAWNLFMQALRGREIEVRYVVTPRDEVKALERDALLNSEIIWEREKHANVALKNDPALRAKFLRRINDLLDAA